MAKPIIAMLTDFGTRDHYAGSLKGVVLTLCPDAAIVDISHDIPPHDILTGALELAACYRFFPAGTIFLAVVDPGVGSARLRHRRRGRRLPVRGARQRGADGGVRRGPAEARGVPHGAPLRAADDQQDVRGPRPLRAGGGLAGARGRSESARLGGARLRAPRDPAAAAGGRSHPGGRAARRSVRQPRHEHPARDGRAAGGPRADPDHGRDDRRSRASWRRTRASPGARSARCSGVRITWRLPRTAARRRRGSGWPRARPSKWSGLQTLC